jgi:hypothetical protein
MNKEWFDAPIPEDWFDNPDFLETRAFYEAMQAYRHTRLDAALAFEHVKRLLRDFHKPADQPTAAEAACWHGGGFVCPLCHPTLPTTPDQQSVRADLEQIAEKYKSALDGLSMQDAPQPVDGAGKQSMRCTRNEAALVQRADDDFRVGCEDFFKGCACDQCLLASKANYLRT